MRRCNAGLWRVGAWTLAVVVFPGLLAGQTVRGTVTERSSGAVASGAVIVLERIAGDSLLERSAVLTDASGAFVVRATSEGSFVLSIRRIGSIPFRSELFVLTTGEARKFDVQLERVNPTGSPVVTLAEVGIRRATSCRADEKNGSRIATLWSDARTALEATEISERDRLVQRTVVRFMREIDVPSLAVRTETLTAFDSLDIGEPPRFRSMPADSLSRIGYWRVKDATWTEFYGLDANALLSEAFVRDHCFSLIEGNDSRLGLVGLVFEPIRSRTGIFSPPEVEGTIWLEAQTSALKLVEFDWTKLDADRKLYGGEVHFARMATGPWFVSSWRLRMPQEVLLVGGRGASRHKGIVEEGGIILDESTDSSRVPVTLHGTVRDVNQRGMGGVTVRVLGTKRSTVTSADGRYLLPDVPPGLHFVVATNDSVDLLGARVGQQQVLLDEGSRREVSFRAPRSIEIMRKHCGEQVDLRNRGVLRITLIDSVTARPIPGARIRLAYRDSTRRPALEISQESDASGAAVFCEVPTGQPLVVTSQLRASGALLGVTISRGTMIGRVIRFP